MTAEPDSSFVAECFWPDVRPSDLEALDRRVAAAASEWGREQSPVRYLGSILIRDDEVVLCQFEGTAEAVRDVARKALIPFERILAAGRSPWHSVEARAAAGTRMSDLTRTQGEEP
jgi:hypothetical protein